MTTNKYGSVAVDRNEKLRQQDIRNWRQLVYVGGWWAACHICTQHEKRCFSFFSCTHTCPTSAFRRNIEPPPHHTTRRATQFNHFCLLLQPTCAFGEVTGIYACLRSCVFRSLCWFGRNRSSPRRLSSSLVFLCESTSCCNVCQELTACQAAVVHHSGLGDSHLSRTDYNIQ